MSTYMGGPRPDRNRPAWHGRQLTVGECIAIERYGTSELDDHPITLDDLLALIDRLEVCTTCGWSRTMHEANSGRAGVVGLCTQHTRTYAQG